MIELLSHELHIDHQIILQVADGNQQAFTKLFYIMLPAIRPNILKIVGSEDTCQEIVQQCFLKVWMYRDQLPGIDKPVNWIFRIASNECFTWLNKQALRHRKIRQYEEKIVTRTFHTPLDEMAAKQTAQLIHEAIAVMPEQKQMIYYMSRNEGLKSEEIAARLQLSHSYVRNSISAVLGSIRKYLKNSEGYEFILLLLPILK